jgi:hypothetical protein
LLANYRLLIQVNTGIYSVQDSLCVKARQFMRKVT